MSEISTYLVLLETSGNQNYIFSTNKVKENVGASELTYRSGVNWVLEVVADINQTQALANWRNTNELRKNLTNPNLNPPIEKSDKLVEIVIAASGKAILLTKDETTAKDIITKLTTKALQEAPGIDLCGVFVKFDWNEKDSNSEKSLVQAIKQLYRKFEQVHGKMSSPNLRFLRLPVVDECSTSGLPASVWETHNEKKIALSKVSYEKQKQTEASLSRINKILKQPSSKRRFVDNVNSLEKKFADLKWLAVVHADGNGLGQIFLNFEDYLDNKNDNREYIDKLKNFSLALDICNEQAFLSAIDVFETDKNGILPIVPLVLGGDDLTIICDGKSALEFTYKFLQAFEDETGKTEHQGGIIPTITQKAFQSSGLSACAGVAIIKPHFPFSVAYELAENLIKQAKNIKRKVTYKDNNKPFLCSALDFHILYDSSGVDLDTIREKLIVDSAKLHNRPYVTTNINKLQDAAGREWAEFHHWDKLKKQVSIIHLNQEDEDNKIATNQVKNLISALFIGREFADNQYKLISQRYSELRTLLGDSKSLYAPEPQSDNTYTTSLLDIFEVVEFLSLKQEEKDESNG